MALYKFRIIIITKGCIQTLAANVSIA